MRRLNLYDALNLFSENEKLSSLESWRCEHCKEKKEASKTITLFKTPTIFVIHLKRFFQEKAHFHTFEKDESQVDFPLEGLDLSEYVHLGEGAGLETRCIYDLYAVSHHFGRLSSGHYTAHVRNANNGYWYEMDDSRATMVAQTTKTAEPLLQGNSAYILFYVSRAARPPGWGKVNPNMNADGQMDVDRFENEGNVFV